MICAFLKMISTLFKIVNKIQLHFETEMQYYSFSKYRTDSAKPSSSKSICVRKFSMNVVHLPSVHSLQNSAHLRSDENKIRHLITMQSLVLKYN